MDKGSMVADSFRFRTGVLCRVSIGLKQAKEGKGNYYEVDGHLFRRDKILGESIGQLEFKNVRAVRCISNSRYRHSDANLEKSCKQINFVLEWVRWLVEIIPAKAMLAKNFKKYFLDEDSLVASYEWIRDLFQDTPEGLSTSEEEIFIDFTSSEN
ncbi:hypothetical protein TNCV_1551221 [Trichonephila clavipes]|nr:hypothetical protein TNCV_1551221 [Trichonephila clavipes]